MAHLRGEAQPIASAFCAIGAVGLAFMTFQLHTLRKDYERGWTEVDNHKMWYFEVAWVVSAISLLIAIPRYVALMTIENFHMVHGPIVLMSSAIALPMMCHAVWININGEIAWAMNLFPWMPFLMLTSKEWRGAAAAAGFSVFITGAIGIYGAHISKLEPLRNAMAAWLASYLFVVLHPDLNAGYSSIPLAGPLQVAGAQLIVELFKKAGPGEISRPVQFPPPKEGEQFAAGGGEYYY